MKFHNMFLMFDLCHWTSIMSKNSRSNLCPWLCLEAQIGLGFSLEFWDDRSPVARVKNVKNEKTIMKFQIFSKTYFHP